MLLYLICLLCGVLTALPLIFENLWWISWFSMAPFFVILMSGKPKYRHGLAFSMGFYGLIYHWFVSFYPMDFLGLDEGTSVIAIAVCWIGLALIQAVPTALVALIFRFVKGKKRWLYPIILACGWTIMEYVQELTWAGVPLCRLEISQTGSLPSIQSASLLGPMFIAFLVALVNGFLALAFVTEKERFASKGEEKWKFKINIPALIAASVFALNYLFGLVSILTFSNPNVTESISVAVIQGDLDYTDAKRALSVNDCVDILLENTIDALDERHVDFVLWSEGAVNVDIHKYESIKKRIADVAKEYKVYIAVGAFEKDETEQESGYYNSLVMFCPDGTLSEDVYRKQKLVPFGEYLPMRNFIQTVLPVLATFNSLDEDMASGTSSDVISTEYGNIGGIICFDSIYENLSRNSARNGAQILFLSTNDSWFKESAALRIHQRHSVLRAVENGKYLIRSAATGISCVINPLGVAEEKMNVHEEGYIIADVTLNNHNTLYFYLGNSIVILSATGIAAAGVIKLFERKKSGKKASSSEGAKNESEANIS